MSESKPMAEQDKCPKCGAERRQSESDDIYYACGSHKNFTGSYRWGESPVGRRCLENQLAQATKERDGAKAELFETLKLSTSECRCLWCGVNIPRQPDQPVHQWEESIRSHVKSCGSNPMLAGMDMGVELAGAYAKRLWVQDDELLSLRVANKRLEALVALATQEDKL